MDSGALEIFWGYEEKHVHYKLFFVIFNFLFRSISDISFREKSNKANRQN